jgi:hypothetical protein
MQKVFFHARWSEVFAYAFTHDFWIERLARKYIEVGSAIWLNEMSADVACLNQLNHAVTLLGVALKHVFDHRFTVCDHVDTLDKVFDECNDCLFAFYTFIATCSVQHQMITPVFVHMFFLVLLFSRMLFLFKDNGFEI